jgi:hypothetical protein
MPVARARPAPPPAALSSILHCVATAGQRAYCSSLGSQQEHDTVVVQQHRQSVAGGLTGVLTYYFKGITALDNGRMPRSVVVPVLPPERE